VRARIVSLSINERSPRESKIGLRRFSHGDRGQDCSVEW